MLCLFASYVLQFIRNQEKRVGKKKILKILKKIIEGLAYWHYVLINYIYVFLIIFKILKLLFIMYPNHMFSKCLISTTFTVKTR